jgi:hypothetical protein
MTSLYSPTSGSIHGSELAANPKISPSVIALSGRYLGSSRRLFVINVDFDSSGISHSCDIDVNRTAQTSVKTELLNGHRNEDIAFYSMEVLREMISQSIPSRPREFRLSDRVPDRILSTYAMSAIASHTNLDSRFLLGRLSDISLVISGHLWLTRESLYFPFPDQHVSEFVSSHSSRGNRDNDCRK